MSVFVQIDDQRIELQGEAAEAELARQEKIKAKFAEAMKLVEQRAAAKQSARDKLAALGLTDSEISAIIGL